MLTRRHVLAACGSAVASSLAAPCVVQAQSGNRTARILVGFAPGGTVDAIARLLADHMKDRADPVIVENRAGASGRLALDALKAAPADGSVLALTPGEQLTLFPHIYRTLSYDPLADFVPVSTVCTVQFLLTVGPAVPASVGTLQQFIAWCRENPKLASYGTPGAGTRHHFFGETLARAGQFEFVHVPYKGAVAAIQDVLAGHVAANITVTSNALPQIRSGGLRALLTTAPQRSAALPDVPTAREAGFPSLESVEWFGLMAPRGTPRSVVESSHLAVRRAVESEPFRTAADRLALDISVSGPDLLAASIRSDLARWPAIVKSSGFMPID